MPRPQGTVLNCSKCNAELTYTKGCDCPDGNPHSESSCGEQMVEVDS